MEKNSSNMILAWCFLDEKNCPKPDFQCSSYTILGVEKWQNQDWRKENFTEFTPMLSNFVPPYFRDQNFKKPKHPRVSELSAAPLPVEEVAPPLQIPGLNLTQFNNIGNFRPNVAIHIPRHSTRACRAKNLFN